MADDPAILNKNEKRTSIKGDSSFISTIYNYQSEIYIAIRYSNYSFNLSC